MFCGIKNNGIALFSLIVYIPCRNLSDLSV